MDLSTLEAKSKIQLIIRAAITRDTAEVAQLLDKAFAPLYSIYRSKGDIKKHRQERSKEGTRLVAEHDGNILGTVQYVIHKEHVHIIGIAVHPDFQRKGIATSLVRNVCHLTPTLGRSIVRIDTIKETGNVPFFEKIGFTITYEKIASWCISDDYEVVHEVIMDKSIE